jgi:SAM-dependent methyltransferase
MTAAKAPGRKQDQDFWNRKARTFPRYSPGEDNYEAQVLALARQAGAVFTGARILDVGCGTGMYTIRLASEALEVTALDFSREMLAVLKEDAAAGGLTNIRTFCCDWLSFKPLGRFDIIFCSMCPALAQEEALEKLISFSGARVVYLGWNGLYRPDTMSGLYEICHIVPKTFEGAGHMRSFLDSRRLSFDARPVEGQWRVSFSREKLLDSLQTTLENYGVQLPEEFLSEYIEKFRQPDGRYLEVSDYKIQMILWQNP